MKRICTFLLVLCLIFSLAVTASAAGSVSYDAGANKFIFKPGTKHSPTSLFENFQTLMPGDTLTDQIQIRNDSYRGVKIKVYMRSLGAQESTDDFLSQMKLTVKQNGDSVLFAAPADQTAQLTDWVYLGTVYSGGKITLDVTLEVPITMGNDYQNKIGYIDWEFKIEELPVESSDPENPKTADEIPILLYTGTMLASMTALLFLLLTKRTERQAQ